MKKLVKVVLIGLIVLVIVAVLGVHFFLDGAIKRGVEIVGPKVTKTDVKLGSASLSLLSGSGKLTDLLVANPEGYKSASAIQFGSTSLGVKTGSLLSDKIIIKSINVQAPELSCETDLKGNNLKKLLSNIEETSGSSTSKGPAEPTDASAKANKKLQVDEFVINGAKLHISVDAPVIGQKTATVTIPDIKLTSLGTGPEGITAAELSRVVLKTLLSNAVEQVEKTVADLAKGGQFMGKTADTNTVNTIQKATKGVGDLFKKK
jgi:hypothetical protein